MRLHAERLGNSNKYTLFDPTQGWALYSYAQIGRRLSEAIWTLAAVIMTGSSLSQKCSTDDFAAAAGSEPHYRRQRLASLSRDFVASPLQERTAIFAQCRPPRERHTAIEGRQSVRCVS
jgi:hypothetical protein